MPVVTVYSHGMTGGCPPRKNDHIRTLRGVVGGWSMGAARRNMLFLMSIQDRQLMQAGMAFAVTLTLRDCPPDAAAWHTLRRSWIKRMERLGMTHLHWVVEWQARRVPHLHGALWFPQEVVERVGEQTLRRDIQAAWIAVAGHLGASWSGQHVANVSSVMGWFGYVTKHAARGIRHYQRSPEGIPPGWRQKTGRVWGKCGQFPVRAGIKVTLQDQYGDGGWYAFRRLVRAWRYAMYRQMGDVRGMKAAKRMLRCHKPGLSRVRGVSDWIPEDSLLSLLDNVMYRGYSVEN